MAFDRSSGWEAEVGRLLHDGVTQTVALLTIDAKRLVTTATGARERRLAEAVYRRSREALAEVREVLTVLCGERPLRAQVRWPARQIRLLEGAGIRVQATGAGLARELSPRARACLHGVVREALVNVMRHACARTVRVSVERVGEGVRATVADDGKGIRPRPGRNGRGESHGLDLLRSRVAALGGSLSVVGIRGHGTRVIATFPLGDDGE
jgi:signal transduction histidine kinase